jgi:hypothetical protein
MSDNLTPTPYDAGWRHGWADSIHDGDRFNPPSAFATEYSRGYGDALSAWDISHGAEMVPEDELTDAQRATLARQRSKLGADWPRVDA